MITVPLGRAASFSSQEIDTADGDLLKIEAACKRFDELERYLDSNIRSLTDCGRAWCQGQWIATANIELTVN